MYFWRFYLEFSTYFLHWVPKLFHEDRYTPTFGSISCNVTHKNFKLQYLEFGKWYRDDRPLYECQILRHWEKCVNLQLDFSVKMKRKLAVSSNFQRKNYMETIDFRISFHTLKFRVNLRCSLHTCLRFEIGSFQERKLRNLTTFRLSTVNY